MQQHQQQRSPSPFSSAASVASSNSDATTTSSASSTCSGINNYNENYVSSKLNLKRKNVDNDDEEVVEAKTKPVEDKIQTRSQTARAQMSCVKQEAGLSSTVAAFKFQSESKQTTQIISKIGEAKDDVTNFGMSLLGANNDQATEVWLNTFKEWNNKNKLSALEQILEICEHSHIKHVHNFIEPKLQRDYISEMPKELILLLLTFVRPKDLYKLAQVSHYWHQIANDTILWKNICRRHRIDLDNLNNNTSMILNEFKENNFDKEGKKIVCELDDGCENKGQRTDVKINLNLSAILV